MRTVQDLINEYKSFFVHDPRIINVSFGPDGRTSVRIWLDTEDSKKKFEHLYSHEVDGIPVMFQVIERAVLLST